MGKSKESPKPVKSTKEEKKAKEKENKEKEKEEKMKEKEDKKKVKEEKKKEKEDKKKSKDNLNITIESNATTETSPNVAKKDKKSKRSSSPGGGSLCSTGKKKGGLFKRIGSFMLPPQALAPASPTAELERSGSPILVRMSQSCAELPGPSSPSGVYVNSVSSPNLYTSNSSETLKEGLLPDPPKLPDQPPPTMEVMDVEEDDVLGLVVEEVKHKEVLASQPVLRNDSFCSVEYATVEPYLERQKRALSFSSDLDDQLDSPRSPRSPGKGRRISFAADSFTELLEERERVVTPEILKMDLATELGVPQLPVQAESDHVLNLPDPRELESLPLKERVEAQARLLCTYECEIHTFRDKSQARWQELIDERNTEVSRIRSICSSLEDENTTLSKRCARLEEKNEELREAYNNIVSTAAQADDFVPVQAHLSSIEGYKLALDELRKRYEGNVQDKMDEIGSLDNMVAELTDKTELLQEEKSLLKGQCEGLQESLLRAQQSSARHKRESTQLGIRVNTLKSSLTQAVAIAEQSTLQKLELAELADLQEQQVLNSTRQNRHELVRAVKKKANAKLQSCADILQEREQEHELSLSALQDKIAKLRARCDAKDARINSLISDKDHS